MDNALKLRLFAVLVFAISVGCKPQNSEPSAATTSSTQAASERVSEVDEQVPSFTSQQAADLCQRLDKLIDSKKLKVHGAWNRIPEWLANELPFDGSSYYEIDEAENAEQLYLRAALKTDFGNSSRLIPEYASRERGEWPNEAQELIELSRARWKLDYALIKKLYNRELDDFFFIESKKLLLSYGNAFADLNAAQQFPAVFIRVPVDISSACNLDLFPRTCARMLALDANQDLSSAAAVDDLRIGLRVGRDFCRLGSATAYLSSLGGESILLDDVAKPIIQQAKDPQQLSELIAALDHHASLAADRIVEIAKNEHLSLRRLLYELETDTFLPRPVARELLSLPHDTPAPIVVHKEMIHLAFYRTNRAEEDRAIESQAKENPELVNSIRKTIESARKLPRGLNPSEGMLLLPLINKAVSEMTAADYQREVETLKTRYHDIELANKQPYPNRVYSMRILDNNWTADDGWKETKFLKWYLPKPMGRSTLVAVLRMRGCICLAAIKKWQLDHDGEYPENVSDAVAAAGIDPLTVIDPYSGQPFFMLKSAGLAVYSVGPDQKNDHGQPRLELHAAPDETGDIVIEIGHVQ